jgi:hypothetical protein
VAHSRRAIDEAEAAAIIQTITESEAAGRLTAPVAELLRVIMPPIIREFDTMTATMTQKTVLTALAECIAMTAGLTILNCAHHENFQGALSAVFEEAYEEARDSLETGAREIETMIRNERE